MGEFSIVLTNRSSDFASLFNDKTKELRIECDFNLAQSERSFIQANALELLKETIWRTELPEAYQWGGYRMALFAAQFREREPIVHEKATALMPALIAQLAMPLIRATFFVPVGQQLSVENSLILPIIFSTFRPLEIGVIDYHGAQRHYNRENVQGINLNLEANEQQRSQTALYNAAAKYNNVKSEMAASFIKAALSEKAGSQLKNNLTETLKELFETFFPHKEFMGPQPTEAGGLSFPVKTGDGSIHDLDDLSAGEKEILYGYLRIRNSAPRNSIIILDEPELHLNPRLIRGLPQFYKKNLGESLGNQMWLVTHSDALLREVVGREGYDAFHMLPCGGVGPDETQLKSLKADASLNVALYDLVGDLAAYRPSSSIVIFEGGGDADFDTRVVSMLFPELQAKANLISGTNKVRVKALHDTLAMAASKGQLPFKSYAVVDKDSENTLSAGQTEPIDIFEWDVYHIENYFLEPIYIRKTLASLGITNLPSEEAISDDLRAAASDTTDLLVRHELATFCNNALVTAINTGTDPKKGDIAGETYRAVSRSLDRLQSLSSHGLTEEAIKEKESSIRAKYIQALADGSWVKNYRGRDILKRYAGKHVPLVSYEVFRNLVLSKMQDGSFKPAGMQSVVDRIIAAP